MSWLVRLTVSVRAGTAMTHIEKMRLQAALQALSGAYATSRVVRADPVSSLCALAEEASAAGTG